MTESKVEVTVDRAKLEAEQEFLRDWLQFIAYAGGQSCCGHPVVGAQYGGMQEMICCGNPNMDPVDLSDVEAAMNKRLNEVDTALAACTPAKEEGR
jgi:hypothetical protein